MGYKKKYKEALERAREFQKSKDGLCVLTAESIFPELKESEDERIRKTLLESFEYQIKESYPDKEWICGVKLKEIVAWLEKQGEKKATDKVEPKFKVGFWIITKDKNVHKDYSICKIVEIENNRYHLENGDYLDIDTLEQYDYYLWTIDDVKDGDVLVDVYGNIGIFQKNDDFDWSSYCSLGPNGGFRCFAIEHELDGSHPATKEQRDLLFKKIEEAGYQWDAKKKELKLLISNGGDFESNNSKQKPTWSDEDEYLLKWTNGNLTELKEQFGEKYGKVGECLSWLKSLKERLS